MRFSLLLGWAAALASGIAGVYLLMGESAAQETTVFDILMHGIGGYLIARGLWMAASLVRSEGH